MQSQNWTCKSTSGAASAAGWLRGVILLAIAFSPVLQAQTYSVLYTFTGKADGAWPRAEVIRDGSGNLYGTTTVAGNPADCGTPAYCGLVYKVDPSGKQTVLFTFNNADGSLAGSYGNLIQDKAGNFYGTASNGGSGNNGEVFRLSPSGKLKVLYSFCSSGGCTDGAVPQGGLVRDSDGTLYGTTFSGGAYKYFGAVFKVTKTGKETVLHSFNGYDGSGPEPGLVADSAGNLYGTANSGGSKGWGTAFKITKAGTFTTLHTFTGAPDGGLPLARLVVDKAGDLYGTTSEGGDPHACPDFGCGVIFEIDKSGKERILYSFHGSDGIDPSELFLDAKGNLFGTSFIGGANDNGNIFELDKSGKFTDLYDFTGGTDGGYPYAGLIQDEEGNFYGTAYLGGLANGCPAAGGADGCGTVFKFTPQ